MESRDDMCLSCGRSEHGQVELGFVGGFDDGAIGDLDSDGVGGDTFIDDWIGRRNVGCCAARVSN
jgi:hypothetical protein